MTTMEETTPLYEVEEAFKIKATSDQLHRAADLLLMSVEADSRGNTESARALLHAFIDKYEEAAETFPGRSKADA